MGRHRPASSPILNEPAAGRPRAALHEDSCYSHDHCGVRRAKVRQDRCRLQNLALYAQRLGKVFASASTWYKTIRQRGWKRPRRRVHPAKPKQGLRATCPNEYWQIDATVIRLTTGIQIYLQAVIDNFSRRILALAGERQAELGDNARILATIEARVAFPEHPRQYGGREASRRVLRP